MVREKYSRATGVIVRDGKVLLVREKRGRDFGLPGGRAICMLGTPLCSVTQRMGVLGKARSWFGMMGWCCQQCVSTFVHQPQNRPNPPRRVGEVLYLFRP